MRGKKPLSEKQVVALRKLVEGNELKRIINDKICKDTLIYVKNL